MKRNIKNAKRTMKQNFPLAVCLFSIVYALSGCGVENEVPVEQTSAYVYAAQQLETSPSGGYSLPEGFQNPAVEGGKLYYMRDTYDNRFESLQMDENQMTVASHTVERAVFPEDGGAVDFAGAEVLFSIPDYAFEKDKGGAGIEEGTINEDEVLAMLDMAMDEESSPVKPGLNGFVTLNPEKDYFRFGIMDYTVDQEQNLYFVLDCHQGDYYDMESLGTVLCKRTPEGEWAYRRFFSGLEPDSLAADGKGGVYLLTEAGILAVDRDGHDAGMISTEEFKGKSFSSERLFGDSQGNVYYFIFESMDSRWKGLEVTPQGGKGLKELGGLSENLRMDICTIFQGNVFFSISGSFYEYDRETESNMEMLQWTNSGLIYSNIRECIVLDGERLLVWYDEPDMEGLYLLVKTPVNELPERKVVVLAAFEAPIAVKNAVVRFNRLNKEYQVVLENYGYSYETASGAQTRLNAALSSSTPPDLLLLSGRDLKKDMEKGLLADLSPYLENSSVLDREDFLENALEGYTIGGRLVGIPVRFLPKAVSGRTSQVSGLDSWTMEDVYALAEQYPEQTILLSDASYDSDTGRRSKKLETRAYLLGSFCAAWYLEEYVDWEKGECNFDSEGFRRLLSWIGKYSGESASQNDSRKRVLYIEGDLPEEALLLEDYITFNTAAFMKDKYGEEFTLTGLPTVDGRGTASLHVEAPLGIVSGAGNREGAWEFLEYYISSSADEEWTFYLPTSRTQLQELMEKALMRKRILVDLDGEDEAAYESSCEMVEKLMEFLETADFTPKSGLRNMVVSIVLEEAEPYYTGDKSLDEVIGIIQNRVQLLLDENR